MSVLARGANSLVRCGACVSARTGASPLLVSKMENGAPFDRVLGAGADFLGSGELALGIR
jgi:hypothetical protein